MTRYIPISKEKHKTFKFSNPQNLSFAKELNHCPVCLDEIKYVLKSQVMVFLKEKTNHFRLYAINNLINKQNLYVSKNGEWMTKYVPAFYRIQPFHFLHSDKKNDLILCYDEDMNLFGEKMENDESFPIFDKKGNLSSEFQKKIALSKGYHDSLVKTNKMITLLTDLDLIEKWPITVKLIDEEKKEKEKEIEGIYRINEEKLNQLEVSKLSKLFKFGVFELVYCQLFSMNNVSLLQQLHAHSSNNSEIISSQKSLRTKAIDKQKKEEADKVNNLVNDLLSED